MAGVKTALVTGSEGGLGVALCGAFQAAGYRVVGTDRERGASGCDSFVELDLADACADRAALEEGVGRLRAAVVGGDLRALVHNAAAQLLGHLTDVEHESWQRTLAVNLSAPLFLTQAFAAELGRNRGAVVNVASVHAQATKPGFVAYATSKAALVGLTRAMAVDLAPAVRVNAVSPAAIDTTMLRAGLDPSTSLAGLAEAHPLGRIARPEEIARVVVFLASDEASFVTGAAVDVDGGILSRLHEPE